MSTVLDLRIQLGCRKILLMEEILHQLIWYISHYLQGIIHPRWWRISSINNINWMLPDIFLAGSGHCSVIKRKYKWKDCILFTNTIMNKVLLIKSCVLWFHKKATLVDSETCRGWKSRKQCWQLVFRSANCVIHYKSSISKFETYDFWKQQLITQLEIITFCKFALFLYKHILASNPMRRACCLAVIWPCLQHGRKGTCNEFPDTKFHSSMCFGNIISNDSAVMTRFFFKESKWELVG